MNNKSGIICGIFVLIVLFSLIALSFYSNVEKSKATIERCLSKGWDGARFVNGFSTQMICSNMTQAEKDAIPEVQK